MIKCCVIEVAVTVRLLMKMKIQKALEELHAPCSTNERPARTGPNRVVQSQAKPCRVMEEALFICIDAGKLVRSTTCMPMEGAQIEIQYNVIRVQSPTHVWLLTGFGFEA
jgi:hypothetical protein